MSTSVEKWQKLAEGRMMSNDVESQNHKTTRHTMTSQNQKQTVPMSMGAAPGAGQGLARIFYPRGGQGRRMRISDFFWWWTPIFEKNFCFFDFSKMQRVIFRDFFDENS